MLQQRITAWVDYHKDWHRIRARHHALATAYDAACQCTPPTPPESAAAQDRSHEGGGAARTAIAVVRTALRREADNFTV